MIENITPQIKTLLAQNRKLEAISLAFEQMGNLSQAKSFIAQLEEELSAPVTQEIVKVDLDLIPEDQLDLALPPDMEEIKSHVLVSLSLNRKIYAVKWVRDQTGWGLKESKLYVDDLQAQNKQQIKDLNLLPQVIDLLQKKGKLEAVKFVKDQTNWSLREAKDYVDGIQQGL